MVFDLTLNPGRRSLRLKVYDYKREGAYFVTICAYQRECLFGEVVDGEVVLNEVGNIVAGGWCDLKIRFPAIQLDEFVVMPNHFHGIVVVGALLAAPQNRNNIQNNDHTDRDMSSQGSSKGAASSNKGAASSAPTLGCIVRAFKSISAIGVNRLLNREGYTLWHHDTDNPKHFLKK